MFLFIIQKINQKAKNLPELIRQSSKNFQRKEINLSELKKALEESLAKKEEPEENEEVEDDDDTEQTPISKNLEEIKTIDIPVKDQGEAAEEKPESSEDELKSRIEEEKERIN